MASFATGRPGTKSSIRQGKPGAGAACGNERKAFGRIVEGTGFCKPLDDRGKMEAQSVLALCFSMASETYRHWRVFTHGSEGVCIEFERQTRLAKLSRIDGLRSGPAEYERIDILETKPPSVDDPPFLKRLPYEAEQEFRLVYLVRSRTVEAKLFPIDLIAIRRITLNPRMPKSLVASVKTTIQSIVGCSKIQVIQTTLLENERWKNTAIRK